MTPMSGSLDGNAAAWPPRDWQCPECSYRSYCTFDADKGGPGNDLRCLNCKAVFRTPALSQTAVEPVGELVGLLTERDGQEFDGEIHLSSEEGARFASTLTAQAAALVAAEQSAVDLHMLAFKWMVRHDRIAAGMDGGPFPSPVDVPELRARAEAAEKRIAELEAGLEPFAKAAAWVAQDRPGWDHDAFHIGGALGQAVSMRDFRRARRLTHQEKNNG